MVASTGKLCSRGKLCRMYFTTAGNEGVDRHKAHETLKSASAIQREMLPGILIVSCKLHLSTVNHTKTHTNVLYYEIPVFLSGAITRSIRENPVYVNSEY